MFRKYVYLMALSRERHFGRAAAACNVSQPTLSNAIRQLEAELQVPIVERGQKFQGFTPEGLKVLEHARRILAERDGLLQDLGALQQGISGTLRLGVIPTALPAVGHLIGPFAERYPDVRISVVSLSSREIQRGLDEFEIDVGVTYLDNEPLSHVRMVPLYSERYFLLTRRRDWDGRTSVSWAEAAQVPLCLLTPDMQNRRIAEGAFRMAGCSVTPTLETNSLMNLFVNVRHGHWSSVVPGQLLTLTQPDEGLVALPLTTPDITYVIGLVYAERDPALPMAKALAASATENKLSTRIAEYTRDRLRQSGVIGF
ncbi:LysR family transcriptional regulator [Novispirillum itersonii]|uniref:LysR family transcriptional regulator n=1 Tax=Novispirillum itersonii TaxID=189 RepID=UPI00037BE11E|nr:LysR family transcriptional regulator [Novispirillum itersonii]